MTAKPVILFNRNGFVGYSAALIVGPPVFYALKFFKNLFPFAFLDASTIEIKFGILVLFVTYILCLIETAPLFHFLSLGY